MKFQPLTDEARLSTVLDELKAAGVRTEKIGEGPVAAHLTKRGLEVGRLYRCSRYYEFDGEIPLLVARALYNDPIGRLDVRVGGYSGNTHPDGRSEPNAWGNPIIKKYHIDTSEGLDLFIHELRRHEIID